MLKGPVSVLYGQAAAGGLLDQESKMPTAEPLHEIGVEFGNYAHKQAKFDFSGPIAGDSRYLYRITGIACSEDWQVNTTKDERIAIALSFTWRPDNTRPRSRCSASISTIRRAPPTAACRPKAPCSTARQARQQLL